MLFVRTHYGDKKRNKVYNTVRPFKKIGRRSEDRRMKTQEETFDLWWHRLWRRKGVFLVAETGIRRIGAYTVDTKSPPSELFWDVGFY